MKNDHILEKINLIKRIFQVDKYPEMSGGCLKFHLLLKELYVCQGYYSNHHIITEINGTLYDINGIVPRKHLKEYYPLSKKSFSLLKSQYEKGGVLSKEDLKLLKRHYNHL